VVAVVHRAQARVLVAVQADQVALAVHPVVPAAVRAAAVADAVASANHSSQLT
jgi:hypothetical protein